MKEPEGCRVDAVAAQQCPSAVKLALLLSSFNSWWCIYVRRSCWMINTVAQGVLGRNRSLYRQGVLLRYK